MKEESSAQTPLAALVAYLIGSVSFAVVVSGAMAYPRSYGSKNPGATNARSGNEGRDPDARRRCIQGWIAVWLARRFGLPDVAVAWVAIAVFLGHLYPVFFRFQGGKGVATAAGVLLAVHPVLAATALTLIIAFFFRYSSLAALVAPCSRRCSTCSCSARPQPGRMGRAGDERAARVASPRQHCEAAGGQESRIGDKKRPRTARAGRKA